MAERALHANDRYGLVTLTRWWPRTRPDPPVARSLRQIKCER